MAHLGSFNVFLLFEIWYKSRVSVVRLFLKKKQQKMEKKQNPFLR